MAASLDRAGALVLLSVVLSAGDSVAAEQLAATVLVKDALTAPNQPVTMEATLLSKGLLSRGLGGEPMELMMHGKVMATAMTGGDGKALFTYLPKTLGIVPVRVRVGNSPRVAPAEGAGNLLVWERRNPIMAVELAALIETPSQAPFPGLGFTSGPTPMPDASEELAKLTQFYYRLIYVVTTAPGGVGGFQAGNEARDWLQTHKFPTGYVLVLPSGEKALGEKIDELHAAGWTTIKFGIGRTKAFAEAFVQRRFEALVVPEPRAGEAPRKAKVAKNWKEVRRKLQ
jgi:hypothetical protein